MYSSTLLNNFIQQLINSTPLPKYKLIEDNEYMDKGIIYQCRDKILRCTESGLFPGLAKLKSTLDYLYASDTLSVGQKIHVLKDGQLLETDVLVTDNKVRFTPISASWELLDSVNLNHPSKLMSTLNLTENSYTPTVHKWLGEYLRSLANKSSVNLMPLYNCNIDLRIRGWKVTDDGVVESPQSTVLLVPIKFNKTYTIRGNCALPVKASVVFYSDKIIKDNRGQEYLHKHIAEAVKSIGCLDPNIPVTYIVKSDQCKSAEHPYSEMIEQERNLCLAIDCGNADSSSIVVLEGDYSSASSTCVDISAIQSGALSSAELNSMFSSNLQLLTHQGNEYMPFSDTLIQYLLRNAVDNRDNICSNIITAENAVDHHSEKPGVWDLKLRYMLYNRYQKACSKHSLDNTDCLGYVDKNVENAIRKGMLKRG